MNDFENDFIDKYSDSEYKEIETLINKAFDSEKSCLITGDNWSLSLDVEKHHSLQYTYHIELSKEVAGCDDEEVNISFENGINNGTQLIDYSLEGAPSVSHTKTIEVLDDLSVDWDWYDRYLPNVNKKLVKIMLESHKLNILDLYSKQSYDNYFTGGGTLGTDKHYKDRFAKCSDMKLHWNCIYKEIEVDRNFV